MSGRVVLEPGLYDDALLEMGNVAFAHAANALSSLLVRRVDLTAPVTRILTAPTVLDVTADASGDYFVAMVRVFGDRQGTVSLVMDQREARRLAGLLGEHVGKDGSFDTGLLCEIANVMSGSALLSIYRFLRISLVHGTPTLVVVEGSRHDASRLHVGSGREISIVITTRFGLEAASVTGWLVISLEDIPFFLDALDRVMAGGPA